MGNMGRAVEPLNWDTRYAVGVDRIDREHESLFNNYNVFVQSTNQNADQTAVTFGLDLLTNYAARHFANEEGVMKAANYPDIVAHQAEHKKFLAELGRLRAALAAGESVYEQLCDFYRTWLTNHIMVSDKKLSKFVYGLGG